MENQLFKSDKIHVLKFLTCNKELLSEGATVKGSNLLLQAYSKNALREKTVH